MDKGSDNSGAEKAPVTVSDFKSKYGVKSETKDRGITSRLVSNGLAIPLIFVILAIEIFGLIGFVVLTAFFLNGLNYWIIFVGCLIVVKLLSILIKKFNSGYLFMYALTCCFASFTAYLLADVYWQWGILQICLLIILLLIYLFIKVVGRDDS